jgi:hypothetical protein
VDSSITVILEHPQGAPSGQWQTVSSRSIADVRSETMLAKLDKVLDMQVEEVSILAPLMPRACKRAISGPFSFEVDHS